MKSAAARGEIIYSSQRADRRGDGESLEAVYRARSTPFQAKNGTLEYFLTERYCLYAQKPGGELLRGEIHHAPWKLREARVTLMANTMLENLQIAISGAPVILHYSKLQEVIAWAPNRVRN